MQPKNHIHNVIWQMIEMVTVRHLLGKEDVFRLDASMQEIGKVTEDSDLVRISRTCIMNISHLTEIKQLKNSHLEATLDNGDRLIVSRKYLNDIKRRF